MKAIERALAEWRALERMIEVADHQLESELEQALAEARSRYQALANDAQGGRRQQPTSDNREPSHGG